MKLSELEKLFYFANMDAESEKEDEMMKDIEEGNYF